MLAAGDMVSRYQAQRLIPHIAFLPRMMITGSHLCIWVERGTVKENCLSQDDMTTP